MKSTIIEIAKRLGCPSHQDPLQWAADRMEDFFEALPLLKEIALVRAEGTPTDLERVAEDCAFFVDALEF
jgi:hypothetical protein